MSSSSSSRAEARRKAILARGSDRLAKLTTSARGDDHVHGGEPSVPPPPPPPKDTPRPSPSPDPSVWSEEQQRQFMQALMGGQPPPSLPTPPAGDDPLASLMAQLNKTGAPQGEGAPGKVAEPPKPPTRLQKWMPLLHLVCMWSLLAVFVLWKEPQTFVEKTAGAVEVAFWKRWPELSTQGTLEGVWGVQVVPFFWAFMTLQVMLHSLHIFTGHNEVHPPALLSLVLPHLPSPFPSAIMNTLRYLRMGSAVLDDVAAVVFGMGMIVLVASWFVD